MSLVYQWREEIRQHLGPLGAWQSEGLALFSYGLMKGRHCGLARIAEELGHYGQAESMERRLKRWIANPRINVENLRGDWIRWVWSAAHIPRAVLSVDETKLGDRLGVMMVSLVYEHRAIPLVWRCYKGNSQADYPPEGQVAMIVELVQQVVAALPADSRPLLMADRGIGHSSALLKALNAIPNFSYLVRIKADCRITFEDGLSAILNTLTAMDEHWTRSATIFTRQRRCQGTVHMVWAPQQAEPWCLITNEATVPAMQYAQRWWQEEAFKDFKSAGWQWESSHVLIPAHAERLVFILATTYAWALSIGAAQEATYLVSHPPLDKRDFSLFRQGLRWFKRHLDLRSYWHIPTQLVFPPLRC